MKQLNNLLYYSSFLIMAILALALIKVFDISYPIDITTTTRSSELSVVGEGKVEVVPDTAYVDVGIVANNLPTTEAVQKKIDEVNNNIIDSLKNLGIKKEDIKTSSYNINPNYNYERNSQQITGYNGNATVSVKIKDTKMSSQVIGAATSAGANQVYGVRFTIDNPEVYREQARDKAIENAKEQAQKLASKLGIKLGKIINIVESSPGNLPYLNYADKMMAVPEGRGAAGPAIEPGSQTVTSTVTLYFERR